MSSPAKTSPRILCVDDRVTSLEVRRALLMQMGYAVLIASDPPSALDILAKVAVDLVVLDYSFPGQMSGEELARVIRAKSPELPLIMLSGYPDLPETAKDSVDVLILKGAGPPTELVNAIASLLGEAPPHPPTTFENQELLQRSKDLLDRGRGQRAAKDKS